MEEFLIEIKDLLNKKSALESKKEEIENRRSELYDIVYQCEKEIELIQKEIEYKLQHYGEEKHSKESVMDIRNIRKVFHDF